MKRLKIAFLALLLMESNDAGGQTTGRTDHPERWMAAPADPLSYYRRSNDAVRLLGEQKNPEAEVLLAALVAEYPLNGANWGRLALAQRRQGKHAAAIEAYKKVMELQGPDLPFDALHNIAISQAAMGDREAALATLERLVFKQAYIRRPALLENESFASLRNDPRFLKIAGKEDVSKLNRNQGWQRDVNYMVEELKRVIPDFRNQPFPAEFTSMHRQLLKDVPRLADEEIFVRMGNMLNVLDLGHTAFWPFLGAEKLKFDTLPLRLYAFQEGLFITRGFGEYENLAGAQIMKIGGKPAEEALRLAGRIQGNQSPMQAVWNAPGFLTYPAVLKGLGLSPSADRAELTLRMPDGTVVVKSLTSRPPPPRAKLNPPPAVEAPLFLKNTEEMHWFEPMPAFDALYVQVNNMVPDKDETLPQFGLRLRRAVAEQKPSSIILDLRHNNGGNTFGYTELLRTLVGYSAVEGHQVYALIGRNVYSAAGNFSTDIERLVRPIFVGEPISQTGNNDGDESFVTLPYSGIKGGFAGTKWQLSHPWDERGSIVPDVPVQLTAKDYFAGRDPVLETVKKMISDKRN
jgi:tetratricopeptide (TPR) repeat protein